MAAAVAGQVGTQIEAQRVRTSETEVAVLRETLKPFIDAWVYEGTETASMPRNGKRIRSPKPIWT